MDLLVVKSPERCFRLVYDYKHPHHNVHYRAIVESHTFASELQKYLVLCNNWH